VFRVFVSGIWKDEGICPLGFSKTVECMDNCICA